MFSGVARGVGSPDPLTSMARLAACVIGACLAVALIEAVIREAWDIAALALVPLYFAGRLYGVVLRQRESERRHLAVTDIARSGRRDSRHLRTGHALE